MGSLALISKVLFAFYIASLSNIIFADQQKKQESISGIHSLRGTTVAITCNNTVESWLRDHEPEVARLCFPSVHACKEALLAKKVPAVVYDAPSLERMAASDCRLQVVGDLFAHQDYGIALPKSHPLHEPLSSAVTYLKEQQVHAELYRKLNAEQRHEAPPQASTKFTV